MNENIDRKLFELIHPDGCWHQPNDFTAKCDSCGKHRFQVDGLRNPSYSSSISDAMAAVEAVMTERRWVLSMGGGTDFAFAGKIRYHVEVGQTWEEGGAVFEAEHESLPTAITLALIEALEVR